MTELLAVGRSILEVLDGPWQQLSRIHELLEERERLIGQISAPAHSAELLEQDRQLLARCSSRCLRLRRQQRWQTETDPQPAKFYDQRS
ncbi:hypothetical protein IV102_26960 [bacterium]|nr:hypothetical protein [bacterium]